MDRDNQPGDADKDDRIRLLEYQVDQLRRELEALEARHAEAIYSAAWHFGWPVRIVERAIRKLFAGGRNDDGPGAGRAPGDAPQAEPPQPLTRDRIARRIAARAARPV